MTSHKLLILDARDGETPITVVAIKGRTDHGDHVADQVRDLLEREYPGRVVER